MSTWVDPNLLSLVGIGTLGDADLADGRHLRWFMGAPLGFPRSGFRLRRHVSKLLLDWDAAPADPLVHSAGLTQSDLGTGPNHRFDSGLTVSKDGWLAYVQTTQGSAPMLRVDDRTVAFEFGITGPGTPPFPPSPMHSNPAAFVRLTILRRRTTGFAVVTGSYDARGSLIVQDRASLGTRRRPDVGFPGGVEVGPLDDRLERGGGRTPLPPRPLNPWVTETVLLRGGWIDRVEVTGRDAVLARIQWIGVREYAGSPGWVDVGRFHLPLTDAPDLYPAWTATPGAKVAEERIALCPPRRNVPWDPPALSVPANLQARYLGANFEAVDQAMRLFLKGQVDGVIPQALVEVTQQLEASGPSDAEVVDARVRPFEHLYAAAAEPQTARLLGLMTTDTVDPAGTYDYVVDTAVPPLWVQWALYPEQAEAAAKAYRETGIDGGWELEKDARPDLCLAMITSLRTAPSSIPDPPAGLQARVDPDLIRRPVQATVELRWNAEPPTSFVNDARARVFYALSRVTPDGDVLLHHKDDESGLLIPHVPTQRQPPDGRLRLVDGTLPDWGVHTWRLRGMDVWGRFSPNAEITTDVRDAIPPPPPTGVQAELLGAAAGAPTWTSLRVSFVWSAAQAAVAPDLERFELHVRQGEVERADAGDQSTWGRLEHSPALAGPPLTLRWPSLALDGVPPGLTASATASPIAADDGGGSRIRVDIGPMSVPFAVDDRAVLAATVRAIDRFANAGAFAAHAHAVRFDDRLPVAPPMPTDIVLASRPDAAGRCAFNVTWPDLGGGHVRVLRSTAQRLLAAAGRDADAFALLDQPTQAGLLRELALEHPLQFSPDHEYPYAARAGRHQALLSSRETALTLFTIELTSAVGLRAAWPTEPSAFIVVAVPRIRQPETPLVREVRGGDRRVTLHVAEAATGDVARLQVYRARALDDTDDVRRMRLIATLAPVSGDDTVVADEGLYADTDYWYRIVAVSPDGTLSPASAPAHVRPFTNAAPPAPSIVTVEREGTTPSRRVRAVVPRRDFPVTLLRRRRDRVEWQPATGPHIGPYGVLDMPALSPVPTSDGYAITVDDQVAADVDARYVYRLRLSDPRGRVSESPVVEEMP